MATLTAILPLYSGSFLTVQGKTVSVYIVDNSGVTVSETGTLTFDADTPLEIEWGEIGKEEVIHGSSATLKIISPGDRTYQDLYSYGIAQIWMAVYIDGTLYWTGNLDAEQYEEPYESASGYTVTLTFNDFGDFDRLSFDLDGLQTIESILDDSLGKLGLDDLDIDTSLISTYIDSSTVATPDTLMVRSDNFYDEDGEAMTLEEVIEGIFQPLGWHIIQRAGKIFIFDLNGLYGFGETNQEAVVWSSDSQTMSADVVYNNIKITWSPYAQSGNLMPTECWDDDIETNADLTALQELDGVENDDGTATVYSWHYSTDRDDWLDATDVGFSLWTAKTGKYFERSNTGIRFFKIVPQYDGEESQGMAVTWVTYRYTEKSDGSSITCKRQGYYHYDDDESNYTDCISGDLTSVGGPLFNTSPNPIWLPQVSDPDSLLLRIGVNLLFDPRFNPFETATDLYSSGATAQKAAYDAFNLYANYLYIPVLIKFYAETRGVTYVWTNQTIVSQDVDTPVKTLQSTYGKWVVYNGDDENPNAWGYLCWYDASDHDAASGVLGWKMNRSAVNPHVEDTTSALTNSSDGQYIPYPSLGSGSLWIEVMNTGWMFSNGGSTLGDWDTDEYSGKFAKTYVWNAYNWILMQLPEIEIVNGVQFEQTIDDSDVEYSAVINASAKESLEIDTVCGTKSDGVPAARGAYFLASTGAQVTSLTRAGRTTQVENLLIGTLYSHYATRHTVLEGEAYMPAEAFPVFTEDNQSGRLFMMASAVEDIREGVSDIKIIEISADEYEEE